MKKTMYGSISEWDIGLSGVVCDNLETLVALQKEALSHTDIDEPFEELEQEGLIGFEEIEVHMRAEGQLSKLRTANVTRQAAWEGNENIGTLFRAVEFGGEAGELLDAVKKLTRYTDGIKGNADVSIGDLRQDVMEEMADVMITLDNLANDLGIPLEVCVPMKFNKTSRKVGIGVYMGHDWDVEFSDGANTV